MERLPRHVNPDAQSSGQRWLKQRHTFLLQGSCAQLGLYDRITLRVFSVTDMSDYYRAFSPTSRSSGLRPSKEPGGGSDQNRAGPWAGGAGAGPSPQVGAGTVGQQLLALPSLKPGRGSESTMSLRGSERPPRSFAEAASGQSVWENGL